MLDKLHLFVPFRLEHIQLLGVEGRADPVHVVDLESLGVPLQGQISRGEGGELQADYLRHAWESLSTGFTPLAFKVFHQSLGKRLMPGVELKASPAKLLQGHNVFGPTCIQKGAEVMFKWLHATYPDLFAKLDVPATQVYALDCTYSSRLPDERTALQVIQALTNVSNGHTKSRGDNYQTSAYWGAKESRLKRLKAYLKHTEFQAQLDELKRAGRADLSAARSARVISDPRLQEWVRYLLRMEATVMHRWLERRGIPSRLVDLIAYQQRLQEEGRCLIQECWQAVTADLFAAFEGIQMRVIDDEKVLAALLEKHTKEGKGKWTKAKVDPSTGVTIPPVFVPGKPNDSYALNLFRTYRSLKDYGWEETMASMARRTFYDHIRDICAAGLSKAALQKLHEADRANNVVPLLRFVQVDFSAQRPDWYVEPTVEAA
ncbi:replication initiation protein [Pseudomonas aeruginosa]|uniref:phage/plasmid replication protein, II/X family n=12 Tax=Pseudomonas aeruginosa TaxID=287 RepID=UPI0006646EBD|nr:phage/plasmid replication protein, II/X family [Pseudomonas aeruginosa]AXZ95251.1 replication initiation protein [Pseudomonas aeruginosa]AXZ95260.1 replication initiation protein [Pseudomonas aeruginosa]KAB0707983.1 replication initiation protein [Pseudomonas aeruginosa]MCW5534157.1 replication initiation protein [Pseudomonas aeruginosa]